MSVADDVLIRRLQAVRDDLHSIADELTCGAHCDRRSALDVNTAASLLTSAVLWRAMTLKENPDVQ